MPDEAIPPAIACRLPGRIRIRHPSLRLPWRQEELAAQLRGLPGIGPVTGNLAAGSILLRYDPAAADVPSMEAAVWDIVAQAFGEAAAPNAATAETEAAEGFSLKSWNRPIKIGMAASLATSLLAIYANRRVHTAAGGLFVALLTLHMASYRRTLFR